MEGSGKHLPFRVHQHTDDGEASAFEQAWICRLPEEGQDACVMLKKYASGLIYAIFKGIIKIQIHE